MQTSSAGCVPPGPTCSASGGPLILMNHACNAIFLVPLLYHCSMIVLDYPRKVEQSSLHSASIHIGSLTEASSNPQPWQPKDEMRKHISGETSGYLSPIKLVQLTAEPDLSRITNLQLTIDTTEYSVGNFGK